MRKLGLALLLLLAGRTVLGQSCPLILALRGLEGTAAVAPPSPEAIRAALDRLRPGQTAEVAIQRLRRSFWPEGAPPVPRRWTLGPLHGQFSGPPRRPAVRMQMPAALLGTPVELAIAIHEYQHARVELALPELAAYEQSLRNRLAQHVDQQEAMAMAYELGEIRYWHERYAMAGDWAVYRVLEPREFEALSQRLAAVPEELLPLEEVEILVTSLRAAKRPLARFLEAQYRIDHYSFSECVAIHFDLVMALRAQRAMEREAQELAGRDNR